MENRAVDYDEMVEQRKAEQPKKKRGRPPKVKVEEPQSQGVDPDFEEPSEDNDESEQEAEQNDSEPEKKEELQKPEDFYPPYYAIKAFSFSCGLNLWTFKKHEIIRDQIKIHNLLKNNAAIALCDNLVQCPKCQHIHVGNPINAD